MLTLRTLEGDPRFFFDDSLTPQAQGTGTEEWGGGGDYWGGLNMSCRLRAIPWARPAHKARGADDEDKIESAYRFLLADLMPFGKNAVIQLEHGGTNESTEHYETVAYWYGLPSPSLVETDRLQIGDAAAERAHGYTSPQASAPYTISSRYEWGVDTLERQGNLSRASRTGAARPRAPRSFAAASPRQSRSAAPPQAGLLVSRSASRSYIADKAESEWKFAGIWYLAGSNTVCLLESEGGTGATEHNVETSNRRFRDDEFLVSRDLTRGRKAIWVRIKFTPVNRPLFPGYPIGDRAWSEIRYTAYCFITPKSRW